jgi:NADH-quinone oxidoreductase subunit J
MIIQSLVFYLFAALLIASAFMVITARNPVHSVLFLILAFFNAAGLFVLLGAEFLAMILVIVYVGAVAVLFLFVVMMLDVDTPSLKRGTMKYLPFGLLVGGIIVSEFFMIFSAWRIDPSLVKPEFATPEPGAISNTEALGNVLYTDFLYLFIGAGFVLLVAMIGAIVLTHRQREGVKKQNIADQVYRDPADAMEVRKVEIGSGI